MAYDFSVMKQGDKVTYNLNEVVVDEKSDIAQLPSTNEWAPGSTALCLEDSSVWILYVDGTWHEL